MGIGKRIGIVPQQGGSGGDGIIIYQYSSDPASPATNTVWVLRTTVTLIAAGSYMGFGALTYSSAITETTYYLSYNNFSNVIERSEISADLASLISVVVS